LRGTRPHRVASASGWRGWTTPWPSSTRPAESTRRCTRSSPWPPASSSPAWSWPSGHPAPSWRTTVLGRGRTYALDHPDDPLVVWRELSAAGFEDHPADCRHCWGVANPALGDFLAEDGLVACLPPKMREASFRRARLCQLTDQLEEAWLPPSAWAACADPTASIPDGAEVVLSFDGSFNGDTTVLVVATVAERWRSPPTRSGGRDRSSCWTARGCRSWSTRSHPAR
jgi:hypothetical protein